MDMEGKAGCKGKQKPTTVEGKGGNNLLCCLPDTCNNSQRKREKRIVLPVKPSKR
jgi:hypothetical protein